MAALTYLESKIIIDTFVYLYTALRKPMIERPHRYALSSPDNLARRWEKRSSPNKQTVIAHGISKQ